MKYLLYPIAWLFAIIVYIRNALYDWKLLPSISSALPIISVGNVQVGGTGKTPFVIALSKQLIENNIKPLIITRGYKRNTSHQIVLNDLKEHSAQEVGDEPYYIKQVLETVPIIIDHNKKNAVKVANQMQGIDCIILDDGFQSRYINKNLDIVLIDHYIDKQAMMLIPVGVLREPLSSLKRAHFTYTKGKKPLAFTYQLHKYQNNNKEIVESINFPEPFIAFCGIGNPKSFILELDNKNIKLGKAGRKRLLGFRPKVRGVVMNPVDHPHGGGEGKTSGGRHPVTPWGKPTKGKKTRKNKRTTRLIIKRRK